MLKKSYTIHILVLRFICVAIVLGLLATSLFSCLVTAEQPVSFSSYSPSFTHTVAIASDGTVWAWGDNSRGELGNGETSNELVLQPVQAKELSDVVAVAAGSYFSLAVKADGTVWAWGDNSRGQLALGRADKDPHCTPVQVPEMTGTKDVKAAFSNVLALKADGTVWAWGSNAHGEAGDGSPLDSPAGSAGYDTQNRPYPCQATGLDHVISIAMAGDNLALKDDGTIWGWGTTNPLLGEWWIHNKETEYTSTPVLVANCAGAVKIAGYGGSFNAVALKNDGTVWSWGGNMFGALGIGNMDEGYYTYTPVLVEGLPEIIDVTSGPYSLALAYDGTVWAWGWNQFYASGTQISDMLYSPVHVTGISDVKSIYESGYSNFAIDTNGDLWAWGLNDKGQLGDIATSDGTSVSIPTKVSTGITSANTSEISPDPTIVTTPVPTDTPTVVPSTVTTQPVTTTPFVTAGPTEASAMPGFGFTAASLAIASAIGLFLIVLKSRRA